MWMDDLEKAIQAVKTFKGDMWGFVCEKIVPSGERILLKTSYHTIIVYNVNTGEITENEIGEG